VYSNDPPCQPQERVIADWRNSAAICRMLQPLALSWRVFAVPFVVFAIANCVHIPFEEAKMRRQFGAAFDNYTNQVRLWI
jgi:protein-S-isoprenylcysteine O-methyltransferase Ste14